MNKQPPRLVWQVQQENISRNQFKEWIVKFGWQAAEPQPDLGEDLLIHVYSDGRATGVTFHVQLKSVTDLEQRKKKRSNFLSYPFEVKDLKHWAKFKQPVILIVWDIVLREGRWVSSDNAISRLDANKPNWRNQKKVSVDIDWGNDTSDSGLAKLRTEVGEYFYPLISRGEELELKLRASFPSTDDGQRAKENFQRFIRQGEALTLEEEQIDGVDLSEWWSRWFLPEGARFINIELIPIRDEEIIAYKIEVLGRNGKSVIFENVEFQVLQSGTDLLILSNENQSYPVHFRIEQRKIGDEWVGTFQPSFTLLGHSVTDTKKIVDFWEVSACGGKTIIELASSKHYTNSTSEYECLPQLDPIPTYFVEFVNKLYEVQNRTGVIINIPSEISDWAISFTNQLFQIISTGRTQISCPGIKLERTKNQLEMLETTFRDGEIVEVSELIDSSSAEIFGTQIPLGKRKDIYRGKSALTRQQLMDRALDLDKGEAIEVELFEVAIIREFENWMQSRL